MKAVLFDAGDTLIHKWVHKADRFLWLCEQAGLPVPDDQAVRLRAARAAERFFQSRSGKLSPEWWMEHNRIGLTELGLPREWAQVLWGLGNSLPDQKFLDPEAIPLLQALRDRGYKIGLVSNWDGTLAAVCHEVGLSPYIDYIGDSHVYGSRKPDPAFFHHVLDHLGVRPENAVHVGDSYGADVLGARAAGVKPILLDPLGCEDRPCEHRATRLAEVLHLCESY